MLTALAADGVPGGGTEHRKVILGLVAPPVRELWMLVRGTSGMIATEGYSGHEGKITLDREQRTFLYSRAHTIYGGSNQIQRNIIGERVLGLPKEPKNN